MAEIIFTMVTVKLEKAYSLHSFPGQSLLPSAQAFLVIVSLSLVCGKSAFLHDGFVID